MSVLEEQNPAEPSRDLVTRDGPSLGPFEQETGRPTASRLTREQLRAAANVLAHVGGPARLPPA